MINTLTGHFYAFISVFIWSALYVSTKILLETFTPLELLFLQFIIGYITLFVISFKSNYAGGVKGRGLETTRAGRVVLTESGVVSGCGRDSKNKKQDSNLVGGARGLGRDEDNKNAKSNNLESLESNETRKILKTIESINVDSQNQDSKDSTNSIILESNLNFRALNPAPHPQGLAESSPTPKTAPVVVEGGVSGCGREKINKNAESKTQENNDLNFLQSSETTESINHDSQNSNILRPKPRIPPIFRILKSERYFILAGLFGIAVYNLFLNLAMEKTTASNVGVIIATAPLFTGLISFIFRLEKPYLNFFIGFIFALLGIFLLTFNGDFKVTIHLIGDILAFISAFGWGIYSVVITKIQGDEIIRSTKKIVFYGIIFMLPALYFIDFARFSHEDLSQVWSIKNIFNLAFLGIFASAACFMIWNKATNLIGAIKTNIYVYLTPIITMIVSMIVLGEKISFVMFIGILITLFGVILSEWRRKNVNENINKSV